MERFPILPVENVKEALEKLEPLFKVRTGGSGEIVSLKVVEGTHFGKAEGGKVLLVLRRNGHLSVHSLIDGRELASTATADALPHQGPPASIKFDALGILQLPEGTIALCHGGGDVGLVPVDLDTLKVQPSVPNGGCSVKLATIFKQGVHYLVFTEDGVHPEGASPQLQARPIITTTTSEDSEGRRSAPCDVRFEPAHALGELEGLGEDVLGLLNCADDLIAFTPSAVLLFTIRDQRVAPLGLLKSIGRIVDVAVAGYNAVVVSTEDNAYAYRLQPSDEEGKTSFRFVLDSKLDLTGVESSIVLPISSNASSSSTDFLLARATGSGGRSLQLVSIARPKSDGSPAANGVSVDVSRELYRSRMPSGKPSGHVTCVVKLDREGVLLGYDTGAICTERCAELESLRRQEAKASLQGAVTVLEVHELGGRPIVIAGSSEGTAAAWDLGSWEIIARWNLFASPVLHIAYLGGPEESPLSNTVAFISANSPIAIVSLFPPHLHFILPGTKSPVESISTAGDEVMVRYAHGLARLCHVRDQDLRRSMDWRTGSALLAEGGWTTWFSLSATRAADDPQSTVHDPILSIDLRTDVEEALRLLPWAENNRSRKEGVNGKASESCDLVSNTQNSKGHLEFVRFLLSQTHTFGLDRDTDLLVTKHLDIKEPVTLLTPAVQSRSLSLPQRHSSYNPWTVSPATSAQQLLRAVSLFRIFLNFPDTERYASQVIVFYASFLNEAVGPAFAPPALDVLADYWLDSSNEIQQTARLLFGTYLASTSDEEVIALVDRWQDLLPTRQPPDTPHSTLGEKAVLLIGLVAAEKFKLLTAAVLKDLSICVTDFLDDDIHPRHQAIATELCNRGFEIWQNYVDAMPLVRQLFSLATGRTASTPNELRNLARLATLHVASINTPLFMTTLSFDILNAVSASHRNATMKLLGFMVRKKPLVLHTSLPRLAEAVVKSLDPTVTHLRETVHQAATVILNELVRTYPSIDFHGSSQRLAVGTHEGAAIVYDLKTATRLYVLEGHTRAVTALSWSPDGRRLVSVSLEESKAVVWKVGVGIFSMFTPGAPPRQGSGGTATPFKTLDFAVGDEGLMTTAATLEWVAFEWPAERTTRLKIRETTLTFSV
ncbi:WD repeat protein [Pseudohyphozyma bogoriensis]|nr:WD repeat protein [Pseudohyphozyma bogoriensis]